MASAPNQLALARARTARMIAELEARTGYRMAADDRIIPAEMRFRAWCERLAQPRKHPETGEVRPGLLVDGEPFRLDDRPCMAWIYDQIPTTAEECYRLVLVLMKCSQVGFTVMEMLAALYLGLKFGPVTVGMFLPDMNLAGLKSTERFMPLVRSIPDVHKLMTQDAADGSGRRQGEGNVNRRRIGQALFIFSWTSGKATTESMPMGFLTFDEVQEMTLAQMEKTLERMSASPYRFALMGSTANWPEKDIHHWYMRGSQWQFHTECPVCFKKAPLDTYFPRCIKWDANRRAHVYVCQDGHRIEDPQRGEWVAFNSDADPPIDPTLPKKDRPLRIRSIHFPQMLSPTISAGEIIDAYNNAEDLQNFYNRKLGKPFMDPSLVPVTEAHLANCVAAGREAGVVWKERARDTFMGIDQMGKFNVHIIKERLPDGRQAVIHVEETYADDPFMRSSELMVQYGVQCCVVEINPNYNDAHRFAKRHEGRVFLCNGFGALEEGMIRWGDTPRQDASDRRTDEEAQDLYTVKADQYKCMQRSLGRFTTPVPTCLFPDPEGLVQEVIDKGVVSMQAPLRRAFLHFTKTALVAEQDEKAGTNKFKRKVKKIGIDPHFSYANELCDVAWARAYGTATFILPPALPAPGELAERVAAMAAPGLPANVVQILDERPKAGEICGRCVSFPWDETAPTQGMCQLRQFIVRAADPGCPEFIEVEDYGAATEPAAT